MNKKLLQRSLKICLLVFTLLFAITVIPSASVETQAATAGFKTVSGKTYYVTTSGSYKKGWMTLSGKKYYFDSKGVMQTGWKTISGKKYYFSTKGIMQTGWKTISSKKYYFNSSGVMQTGWKTISNNRYYFNSNGVMQTGFIKLDGKTYYLKSNGVMATGWLKNSKGQYRYCNSKGVMQTGWLTNAKGQKRYFSKSNGVMATGWMKNSSGQYRYFSTTDGVMYIGMKKIGSYYYYFRKSNGTRYQNGFGTVSGKKYYFNKSNGRRRTGWLTLSGKKYYFASDGVMYASRTATIGGVKYTFDSNGVAKEYVVNNAVGKTGLTVVSESSSYVMVTDSGRSSTKQYKLHINYMTHPGVADGTLSDLDLLAAVCDAEANDQGLIGMQAVAMCLLNRTLDTYYPASLRGVVYQMAPGIQYAVVTDGALKKRLVDNNWQKKELAYQAAQKAMDMFEAYVKYGTKRKLEGFDRDDFNFKFFMMDWCYWEQPLNFSKVDNFLYKDHMFFVDWV